MKKHLTPDDKKIIIEGLKKNVFPVSKLNHLSKIVCDHSNELEMFPNETIELTDNDKRQLLIALQTGNIDFSLMPDLAEKLKENFFLKLMIAATSEDDD